MDKTIGYTGLARLINSGYVKEFLLLYEGKVVFQCFALMGYNQPPRTNIGIGGRLSEEMVKAYTQVSSVVFDFLYFTYHEMLDDNARIPMAPLPLPQPAASKLSLPRTPLLPPLPQNTR